MNTTAAAKVKTLAIFGAGPGLGAAVAARFGREGYRVALVARRAGPLEERVAELGRAGVHAAPFPGDLTDIGGIPALVRAIEEKLGAIDVALYAPVTADVAKVHKIDDRKGGDRAIDKDALDVLRREPGRDRRAVRGARRRPSCDSEVRRAVTHQRRRGARRPGACEEARQEGSRDIATTYPLPARAAKMLPPDSPLFSSHTRQRRCL